MVSQLWRFMTQLSQETAFHSHSVSQRFTVVPLWKFDYENLLCKLTMIFWHFTLFELDYKSMNFTVSIWLWNLLFKFDYEISLKPCETPWKVGLFMAQLLIFTVTVSQLLRFHDTAFTAQFRTFHSHRCENSPWIVNPETIFLSQDHKLFRQFS